MYNTSSEYKTAIRKSSRSFKAKITVGDTVLTDSDIVSMDITINQGSETYIGNTISKVLDLVVLNKNISFNTNYIVVEIGIDINGNISYIPLGTFIADNVSNKKLTTTVTAYDNMYKTERAYFSEHNGISTAITTIMNDICSKCDLTFKGTLPNYNITYNNDHTCREMIGYIASLCGGNAFITNDNKLTIKALNGGDNTAATTDNYFNITLDEETYKIGKITCTTNDEEISKGSLGTDDVELQFANPYMTDSFLSDIYQKLYNFEFLGYTCNWQGDLALEPFDIVNITDDKNVVRKCLVLGQKLSYNGGLISELSAKGKSKSDSSYNPSMSATEKVNRMVTDLLLVKEEMADKITVDQLIAGNIKFNNASGGTLDLQSLLSQFISGKNAELMHLTGQNVVIDEAVIKNLIASKIKVSDLMAGNIDSERFNIVSKNGNLIIKDNTIQIKDSNRVRIQIGKDASGDYTLNAWDKNGKLLFNSNGITADAIKNPIIRDDMVADNANIDGSKVNIESLIECVNNNNTKTLKSSKILMDGTSQTIDVAFKKINSSMLYNQAINTSKPTNITITTTEPDGKANVTNQLTKVLSKKMKVGDKVKVSFDINGTNLICKENTKKAIFFQGSGNVTGWNAGAWNSYAVIKPTDTITSTLSKHCEYTFTLSENHIKNAYWSLYLRVDRIDGNFTVSNIMVQIEEPFVDFWTKSPYDDEDSINTLQTEFNVQQGQINQLVKDTTITEGGTTKKLKDAYNETKSAVDGTVQTVAKVETQVKGIVANNMFGAGGGSYLDATLWSKTSFKTGDAFSIDGSESNKWYRLYSKTANNCPYVTRILPITTPKDKKVSISFRYYCNDAHNSTSTIDHIRLYLLCEHNNSGNFYNSNKWVNLPLTVQAKYYTATFELHYQCTRFQVRFDLASKSTLSSDNGIALRFRDISVVYGTLPSSEWTPSYVDIGTDINSIETRTSKVEQKTTDEAFTVQVQKNQNRQFNVRYIRDYCNGNNSSYPTLCNWIEIQAISNIGTNLALNKTVTSNVAVSNLSYITDGDYKDTTKYANASSSTTTVPYVQIDLGQVYTNIDEIKVWHYYKDNRKYHKTKTMVSADGTNWITLFDSSVSGEYWESVYGHSIKVNGTSFNSSQVTINELGLHVKNGAIDIQNNSGDTVFGADTNGNLNFLGTMKQKDPTTGRLSTAIKNNGLEIYDWRDMDGTGNDDLVGGILAVRNTKTDRGGIMIYSDIGNLLHIGYKDGSNSYSTVLEIDDTKQQNRGLSRATLYEAVTFKGADAIFADCADLNFYGNDYSALLGEIGLDSSNQMFVVGKRDFSSPHLGYLENNNSSLTYKLVVGDNNKGTTVYGDFNVSGTKNRVVKTKDYNWLGLNAFETAECYFGDWLFAKTDDKGYCMIYFEDKFLQTINTKCRYHVMCSAYGNDDDVFPRVKCIEQKETYFIIKTDVPGTEFSVLVSAKQKGYENTRLKNMDIEDVNQADVYEELNKIVEEENKK